MRLFLALHVPEEVRKEISRKIPRLVNPPEKFHVTLAFIGDRRAEEVVEKLRDFSFKPFDVEFRGQSEIPHINGFQVHSEELIPLIKELHSLLGIRTKHLTPHLTLSRKEKMDLRDSFKFKAQKIFLLNSVPAANGQVYHVVKEFVALK